MKVTVIGCGRWGSFIAWYLDKIGHQVVLYGRENSKHMIRLQEKRSNGLIEIPKTLRLETDLKQAVLSDVIGISINSQGLRNLVQELRSYHPKHKYFVLCMKGIEISSGKRLTEIIEEGIDSSNKVAVWLGPGHVQEFYKGIPNCMVIDSKHDKAKELLVLSFSSDLIRFYYGDDLIGNEIGAAAKNVIGIAAGMLDGLNLTSLKGALMSRGTREIARLIKAMGGSELSAYGLCHLGDYEATVFSQFSHNRRYGEMYVKGEEYKDLAEGYYTVEALIKLGKEYKVELPICNAVHQVLYNGQQADLELEKLFLRSLKKSFK
ncbi:NAD(P)H-dependent glycerol-3-phosphate dehydrogenase [Mobilitalea sibirica]|uniref:Glycerol-3-phosphate dehydrogenase n=1 Tax=Mobilitalea sibirica TaxID=1462919 RepID=A0A8J7H283_9FIRM|nr:NAD(P)H-dependent glycerol-3-phosphate dehydrogenase [Mobilitalea sibirica]MBH1940817.1 NAD(P)H-dependent glycerol-3-phosphate dehydrogenase [Mobilitalea sibirica]